MSPLEQAIAAYAEDHPHYAVSETAWGMCCLSTQEFLWSHKDIEPRLRSLRVTGQEYPGREHWAVIVFDEDRPEDSQVIDFTLRQFLGDAPYPFTGTLLDWYDLMCDGINDYLDVEVRHGHVVEWTDTYDREDFEPGSITYPWRSSLYGATA